MKFNNCVVINHVIHVRALTETWTVWPIPCSVSHNPPAAHRLARLPYRPQVTAQDRVLCWTLPKIIAQWKEILTEDWCIKVAMDAERVYERVWESGTRSGHGAGLLRFTEYCESRGIPEIHQFPLTDKLTVGFIGWAAGQLGQSAVRTWLAGLRAWHTVHGFQYIGEDSVHIRTTMTAIGKMAPLKSKRPPCMPVTTAHCIRA